MLNVTSNIGDTIFKINSLGITVDGYKPALTEELDIYYDSIKNGWWEEFCDDIHFYGAEDELYRQTKKELHQKAEYGKCFNK